MNQFSVFNYEKLSDFQKTVFNKSLAQRLSILKKELVIDDVVGSLPIDEFIASSGAKSTFVISEIYSKVKAGIQAGSGNQNLFHNVLSAYVESWKVINKQ